MTTPEASNVDIVVIALGRLGGAAQKVSTEDIAVKAHTLAPDRFAWKSPQYRQYPDKDLVRVTLMDAAKPKYGARVTGRYGNPSTGQSMDGWRLTPAGVDWLQEAGNRLLADAGPTLPQMPQRDVKRFINRIRSDAAYQQFKRSGTVDAVTDYMFTDLLSCSPDAPYKVVHEKYERLRNVAKLVGDAEILAFLDACGLRFANLMSAQRG